MQCASFIKREFHLSCQASHNILDIELIKRVIPPICHLLLPLEDEFMSMPVARTIFSEEHELFRTSVRRFMETEISTNLAGLPGISVPCGLTAGKLPVGLQLQAPALNETRLLQVAHQFQQLTAWHLETPKI